MQSSSRNCSSARDELPCTLLPPPVRAMPGLSAANHGCVPGQRGGLRRARRGGAPQVPRLGRAPGWPPPLWRPSAPGLQVQRQRQRQRFKRFSFKIVSGCGCHRRARRRHSRLKKLQASFGLRRSHGGRRQHAGQVPLGEEGEGEGTDRLDEFLQSRRGQGQSAMASSTSSSAPSSRTLHMHMHDAQVWCEQYVMSSRTALSALPCWALATWALLFLEEAALLNNFMQSVHGPCFGSPSMVA